MILGILKTSHLRNLLEGMSPEFKKIRSDHLSEHFNDLLSGSPEEGLPPGDGSAVVQATAGSTSDPASPHLGGGAALDQFCSDLTEKARQGGIDPVVGRDEEIRQVIDVLMRRRQNNPILTGEAGVGKTAVVEGFALRIATGDVPPALRTARLLSLDIGLLQAGAGMKGEFENRLKSVIEGVQASPVPIVMFIDETHTLIGAGGAAGAAHCITILNLLFQVHSFRRRFHAFSFSGLPKRPVAAIQ